MALLTPMTLAEAQAIGDKFGLTITALDPIPHGSVNSNFALALLGGGKRFLRVCEESDAGAVRAQNRLLGHLVGRGVPTPAPLVRVDGRGTVVMHGDKPAVVFPFVAGSWLCQRRIDEPRCERVGEVVATIHQAGASYEGAPPNRFSREHLRERLHEVSRGSHGDELTRVVALLGSVVDELEERQREPERPTVIHGDVFRDNVLWDAEALTAVLDFESASMGHPSFDLMVAMLAFCFTDRLEQGLARALVRGYRRRRELGESERDACYDEARFAAVRFAITRITDYELRPRDVVVYKDYRRFVARLEAVEMIGARAFPEWLGWTG